MYLPYRTIGYVVDSSPVDIKRAGSEHFITASIGSAWQIYKGSNLRCVFVSPEREGRISAIASHNDITYTAVGREVIVWKRAHEITRLIPEEGNRIMKMMLVGDALITLSADRHVYVWDCSNMNVKIAISETHQAGSSAVIKQEVKMDDDDNDPDHSISDKIDDDGHELTYNKNALYKTLTIQPLLHMQIPLPPNSRHDNTITTWCHPPTYTNKIVIGWSSGEMELWNINSCKMIYRFSCLDKHEQQLKNDKNSIAFSVNEQSNNDINHQQKHRSKASTPAITVITHTPALDVVAIGRQNGDIILCNLKLDRILHVFNQSTGPVTALTFRTDDNQPHFISTCPTGNITMWDLEKKQTVFIHRNAHGSAITSATFLAGEPILITSGRDNAIYQWKLQDVTLHLLRSQSGHFAPPTNVKFFSDREILTGGRDKTLRYWSPVRDRSAQTLSWSNIKTSYNGYQAKRDGFIEPKLRYISELEVCPIVLESTQVTALSLTGVHDKAVLWSIENKRAEKLVGLGGSPAVKSCFSFCGNFVFIAYKEGTIKKFNIESGIYRGVFSPSNVLTTSHSDRDLQKNKNKHLQRKTDALTGNRLVNGRDAVAHPSGIIGLFCTMANQSLVSVGTDGLVYVWDIAQCAVQHSIQLNTTITHATYANELQLLAVAGSDSTIQLIDTTRCIVVRKWSIKRRIGCCKLYPLHGLLLVADVAGGLLTFDLASGALIDWSHFTLPITSMDVCPVTDSSHGSDLLATTHTDSLGVHLWVVNTSKQTIITVPKHATRVAVGSSNLDRSDNEPIPNQVDDKDDHDSDDDDEDEDDSEDDDVKRYKLVNAARVADVDTVYQSVADNMYLTTLSGIRSSRWKLLTQQRAIAQRNAMHVNNALKQKNVPFFLNIKTGQKKRDVDEILAPLLDEETNPFALKDKEFKLDIGKSELVNLALNIPHIGLAITACYKLTTGDDDDDSDDDNIFVSLSDPRSRVDNASPEESPTTGKKKKNNKSKQKENKQKHEESKKKSLIADDLDDEIVDNMPFVDPTPYLMKPLTKQDHMTLIPLTQYLLAASPASIAVQLTECSSAKNLHAILHALYLIIIQTSSNIDAIASILSYALDQHSLLIAKHPSLRVMSKLLLKVSNTQWKSVEQLLQSNIAVLNHLCGMHSQL